MKQEDKASLEKQLPDFTGLVKKLQDFTGLPFQLMEMEDELCAGLTTEEVDIEVIGIRMGQSTEDVSLDFLKKIYESCNVKNSTNNLHIAYIPLSKVSDDIVKLESKLLDRNNYFDRVYNTDYKECADGLEKIKEIERTIVRQFNSQGMPAKAKDSFYKKIVNMFSEAFAACEQLKFLDFTSANNREKSDRLLNDLLVEADEFFKFIGSKDLSEMKVHIYCFSLYLFNFLKSYGETAERLSVNFEIDTRLWSSPIYLNLLLESLNRRIANKSLELDVNYVEKILLYGSQALELKDNTSFDKSGLEINLDSTALLTYIKSQNFQAALNCYDAVISKYKAASYKEQFPILVQIIKNFYSVLSLFKSCLSLKIVEKADLSERIDNLKIYLRKVRKISHGGMSHQLPVQKQIYFNEKLSLIQGFIQGLETIQKEASVNSTKNSKKKNKKKQAQKDKPLTVLPVTVLPEKKPETLKPKEDKTDISQAPASKDNKSEQVSALVPPTLIKTVRISDELIKKHEQDRKNKYLRNRKTKVDMVEDKSEEAVFYPLTNRFLPGNKKIQAMITKELLEKLPLSLINAAILVLKGGLIGIKKNEVNPFAGTDRQRFKLPQEVTHGMTLTGKFGTYHLFARWSETEAGSLEFNCSDYTI